MDEPKMNREDIIRMAREAGFNEIQTNAMVFGAILERFFHMAQAAEREACAKLIEDYLSVGLAKEMARIIRDH